MADYDWLVTLIVLVILGLATIPIQDLWTERVVTCGGSTKEFIWCFIKINALQVTTAVIGSFMISGILVNTIFLIAGQGYAQISFGKNPLLGGLGGLVGSLTLVLTLLLTMLFFLLAYGIVVILFENFPTILYALIVVSRGQKILFG